MFLLKNINQHNETHYFVRSGDWHESRTLGRMLLIAETSPNRARAKRFELAPEAAQVLLDAKSPDGWTVEAV